MAAVPGFLYPRCQRPESVTIFRRFGFGIISSIYVESFQDKFTHFAGSFYDWAHSAADYPAFQITTTLSAEPAIEKAGRPRGDESFVALSLVVYYFFLMLPMQSAPTLRHGYFQPGLLHRAFALSLHQQRFFKGLS